MSKLIPFDEIEDSAEFQALPVGDKLKVIDGWADEVTEASAYEGAADVVSFAESAKSDYKARAIAGVIEAKIDPALTGDDRKAEVERIFSESFEDATRKRFIGSREQGGSPSAAMGAAIKFNPRNPEVSDLMDGLLFDSKTREAVAPVDLDLGDGVKIKVGRIANPGRDLFEFTLPDGKRIIEENADMTEAAKAVVSKNLSSFPDTGGDIIARLTQGALEDGILNSLEGGAALGGMMAARALMAPMVLGASMQGRVAGGRGETLAPLVEADKQLQASIVEKTRMDTLNGILDAIAPVNPMETAKSFAGENNTILRQLPRAVGQGLGNVALGLASGGAAPLTLFAANATAMGNQAAEEAVNAGRPETASAAFLENALAGGAIETVTDLFFTKAFKTAFGGALDVAKPGATSALAKRFTETVKVASQGAASEAGAESLQTMVANDVARRYYDENRKLFEGIGDAAAIGALTGLILGGSPGAVSTGAEAVKAMRSGEFSSSADLDQMLGITRPATPTTPTAPDTEVDDAPVRSVLDEFTQEEAAAADIDTESDAPILGIRAEFMQPDADPESGPVEVDAETMRTVADEMATEIIAEVEAAPEVELQAALVEDLRNNTDGVIVLDRLADAVEVANVEKKIAAVDERMGALRGDIEALASDEADTTASPVSDAQEGIAGENASVVPRNTDLFPDDLGDFGGKVPNETTLRDYSEKDGIGTAVYVNPNNQSEDVFISAFGDNDFLAYIRVYDDKGNPTNRFVSTLDRQTERKGATKQMIQSLQEKLPEGHEYTENDSVSTDGLRFISSQLGQGYEVVRNPDGSAVTERAKINGGSAVNDLGADVIREGEPKFERIRVTTQEQFERVRDKILPMLEGFGAGLGKNNITWESGTVVIDMPVLRKKGKSNATAQSSAATVAATNQNVTEPVSENEVAEATSTRKTRHRVFEGGSPMPIPAGEGVLTANDDTLAFRVTGQPQIDDIIASGEVRAKEGKMRGGRTGETQWSRGHSSLGYRAASNKGRYVVVASAENLNDRDGGMPVTEVSRIFKSDGGAWIDVTDQIKQSSVKTGGTATAQTQSPATPAEVSSTEGGVATVTGDLPDHVNAKSLPVFIAKDWTELTADELPPLNRELEGYGQWRRTIAAMLLPGGTKIQHEAIAMELGNEIASENSAMGVDSWQHNILAGSVAGQLLTGAKPEIIERAKSRALSDELAQWESGRKFDKAPISVALVESQGMNVPEGYVQDGDIYVYRPIQSPTPAPANESEISSNESVDLGESEVINSFDIDETLRVDMTQNADGSISIQKFNNETGAAIPIEGAAQPFPDRPSANAFLQGAFTFNAKGQIVSEAAANDPAMLERGETDDLMILLAAEKMQPSQADIRTIGRVAKKEQAGFRGIASDVASRSDYYDAPLLRDYKGEAQERLRNIYDRNSSNRPDQVAQMAFNQGLIPEPTKEVLFAEIKKRLDGDAGRVSQQRTSDAEIADMVAQRDSDIRTNADEFYRAINSPYRRGGVLDAGQLQTGDRLQVGEDTIEVLDANEDSVTVRSRQGEFTLAPDEKVGYDSIEENGIPLGEREGIPQEDVVSREDAEALTAFLREKLQDNSISAVPSREHSTVAKNGRELEAARRLARLFNRRVVGVLNLPSNGAVMRPKDNSPESLRLANKHIFVATDSTRTELLIVAHELLHQMRQTDGDLYGELLDVLDADLTAYVNEARNEHSDKTLDVLREEFLADYLSDKAADPAFWESLALRDPSLFDRFVQFIRDFLRDLRTRIQSERVGVERYLRDAAAMQRTMEDVLVAFRARQSQERKGILDVPLDESMPFADERFADRRVSSIQDPEYLAAIEQEFISASDQVMPESQSAELSRKFGPPDTNGPGSRVMRWWDDANERSVVVVRAPKDRPAPAKVSESEMNDRRYLALVESLNAGNPVLPDLQRMVDEAAIIARHGPRIGGIVNGLASVLRDGDTLTTEGDAYGFEIVTDEVKDGELYISWIENKSAPKKTVADVLIGLADLFDLRLTPLGGSQEGYYESRGFVKKGKDMVLARSSKSADPVTYDESGNVIPLSKRFNPKSDDIRFADERKTKPNQQVFGQDIGREDEIQSKEEVQAAVKAGYFDGDTQVSYWSKDAAFATLGDIEAGRIDPTADTDLDGANQALVTELWKFANAMLREEGDASLLNRMRGRVNDYWNREATKAARALNARGWAQSPMDGTLSAVEDGKRAAVERIAPGANLTEDVEQIQGDVDAITVTVEDFTADEVESVATKVRGKERQTLPGMPETMAEQALSAGRKVGANLRRTAEKLNALLQLGDDILFSDPRVNDGNKRTLIQQLILDQSKKGNLKRGAFIRTAVQLGLSEEVAANRFDAIAEIRAEAKIARELDAKEFQNSKTEQTADQKLLASLNEESQRLDKLNEKAAKISDRLKAGAKTRPKPDPSKRAPLDAMVADAIANSSSREQVVRNGLRLGLTQAAASRLADAIAVEVQNRQGRKKRGEKADINERARKLAERFANPVDRPVRERDGLRMLINQALRVDSTMTEQGFLDGMKALGARPKDSADLWAAVATERVKRQEIRDLKKQADAERSEKEANQREADSIIKRLAKSQSDTQDNRPGKPKISSIVEEMYRDAIGYGPVRSRAGFVRELEAVDVDTATANRLFELAMKERQNRTIVGKGRDALRVFGRPDLPATDRSIPFIMREILAHPSLKLVGPEERLRMMSALFQERAGLSAVDARVAATQFDSILVKKWEEAALRLAEETATKRNAPWFRRERGARKTDKPTKTTFDKLREAIRSGAMDPRKRLLDEVAKSNGWMDLTDSELKRLAELDALLGSENITPFEDVRHKREMSRIINASSLPQPLSKSIREYYLASIFSGVKTWVLQTSVIFNTLANVGLRDPAIALAQAAKGDKSALTAYTVAMGNTGRYLRNAIADGSLAFLTGDIRGIQEAEILAAVSGLEKISDRNMEIWNNPNASVAAKTAAAVKIALAANRFFFRVLGGLDNFFQGFIRSYTSELEAFNQAASLGIPRGRMRALTAEVLTLADAFAEEADAKGFTGFDKQAFVNDRISMAIFAGLEGQGVNLDGIRDRSFREAGLETGVVEFQTGLLPFGLLAKHLQKWSNEGGVIATLLVPVVRTPYQVLHRSAWWSPYGIARLINVGVRTGGFRNWQKAGGVTASPYETALADPVQLLRRSAETALGTAAFTALAVLMAQNEDEEEEDKTFRINLGGPKTANRAQYTAWRETGRRPFSMQFKVGDNWATLGFRKGGMEFFNFAATILGSWEQRKYNSDANANSDMMNYVGTLGKEMTGEALFFLRGFSSRYALMSEDKLANQLGFMLSGFVPAASLLKTPNKLRDYQDVEPGFMTAFLSQVPVIPMLADNKPMLNSLGDPLGADEKELSYVMSKFGMPMGWVPFKAKSKTATGVQDEDLYMLLFEKDYFPSVKSRKEFSEDASLDKYRQFVQLRGQEIKAYLKSNYEMLSKMEADKFKKVMAKKTTSITNQVQKKMKLQ
jgi:hypothetical protein